MRSDRPATPASPPASGTGAPGPVFPFAAVVGTDEAKLALLLAVVDPTLGGVLLRGDKGSAKSTLVRSLAPLLPTGGGLTELPLGATEERVTGSLDLAAALGGDGVRFSPGVLADAHQGLLYVDEVNLLADHLVDLLLDAAASGRNRVERDGVSHSHEARFVLVGSMNPEEGDLRPQLLDRFGLAVDVRSPLDPVERAEVVRRRLAFDADPEAFTARWADDTAALAERLATARPAALSDELLVASSTVCAAAGAEGLRADLTLARAAAAHAGWAGRTDATADDVRVVAHLVLAHRGRRNPLDGSSAGAEDLQRSLDEGLGAVDTVPGDDPDPSAASPASGGGHGTGAASNPPAEPDPPGAADRSTTEDRADRPEGGDAGRDRDPVAPSAEAGRTPGRALIGAVATVGELPRAFRRDTGAAPRPRGRTIGHRPVATGGATGALAVVPTAQAAATRHRGDPSTPSSVTADDLREPVRRPKVGNLLVLAVDASGSMGAAGERLAAVKGALLALLVDAYQRRDRVALVTFRDDAATVVLEPTASVELARRRLDGLATGGTTPLAAGLRAAADLARRHHTEDRRPVVVLVTDGRATVADRGIDPGRALGEALAVAAEVSGTLSAVVVDVEDPSGPYLGLALRLADALGAVHVPLGTVTAGGLEAVLRGIAPERGR